MKWGIQPCPTYQSTINKIIKSFGNSVCLDEIVREKISVSMIVNIGGMFAGNFPCSLVWFSRVVGKPISTNLPSDLIFLLHYIWKSNLDSVVDNQDKAIHFVRYIKMIWGNLLKRGSDLSTQTYVYRTSSISQNLYLGKQFQNSSRATILVFDFSDPKIMWML